MATAIATLNPFDLAHPNNENHRARSAEADGLQYFRSRVTLAECDVEHGLQVTLDHFTTRAQQERALEILQVKPEVLVDARCD